MSDETIKIGSGKSKFQLADGTIWEMDIASTLRDCERIRKQVNEAGQDNFDFLDLLVQLVQDAGGPMLSTGQADEFWDALNEAYLSIKKKRQESSAAKLKSLHSMG